MKIITTSASAQILIVFVVAGLLLSLSIKPDIIKSSDVAIVPGAGVQYAAANVSSVPDHVAPPISNLPGSQHFTEKPRTPQTQNNPEIAQPLQPSNKTNVAPTKPESSISPESTPIACTNSYPTQSCIYEETPPDATTIPELTLEPMPIACTNSWPEQSCTYTDTTNL